MEKAKLERHKIAAQKLELIKNKALQLIKRNLGRISEYEVQEFILAEYRKEGMVTTSVSSRKFLPEKHPPQIVAVNENSANPHYFPVKGKSKIINKNSLILIDIWARLKEENSPFADITQIAFAGKKVPKEIQNIFKKVIGARNLALSFIRKNLQKRKLPKTREIDKVVRDYFKRFALDKYFLHGLGHSLGLSFCHGRYFRLNKKSRARLKINIPFTIEPGLYFKGKFGLRSEINCYINEDYKLALTTPLQKEIIKI